jgi:L-malate glycosyltransferase
MILRNEKFAKLQFFVLNSRYETVAIVCIEALSRGILVIFTRCGGSEESITTEYVILIEPGNNLELINAMNCMLDNSTKYDPEKLHSTLKIDLAMMRWSLCFI